MFTAPPFDDPLCRRLFAASGTVLAHSRRIERGDDPSDGALAAPFRGLSQKIEAARDLLAFRLGAAILASPARRLRPQKARAARDAVIFHINHAVLACRQILEAMERAEALARDEPAPESVLATAASLALWDNAGRDFRAALGDPFAKNLFLLRSRLIGPHALEPQNPSQTPNAGDAV